MFFCVFQTSYWDENISSEVNWIEQNWQEDDNGKVNSQKTKPYQWSLTSYNFVLRKAHETPPPPFFFKSTPNNFTVFYIQNLYTVLWGTNAVWWRKAALLASLRLLLSLYDICTFFCYHKWVCFAGQSVFKMGTCNIFLHSNLKGTYYAIFSLGHLIYFSSSKLQLRVICPE